VHIEGADQVGDLDRFRSGADEDEDVAQRVGLDDPAGRHEWAHDLDEGRGGDEAQWNDVQAETAINHHRGNALPHDCRTRHRLFERDDLVDVAGLGEGRAVHGQNVLEHADYGLARQRPHRAQRDGALDARVDDVTDFEGVAENGIDYFPDVGVDEIERDGAGP